MKRVVGSVIAVCIFGAVLISPDAQEIQKSKNDGESALRKLQEQIVMVGGDVSGFDKSMTSILKQGLRDLEGNKDCFRRLILTMGENRLSVLSRLVFGWDPVALAEAIDIVYKFFGPQDYKIVGEFFQARSDIGRTALFHAVLRKKPDMVMRLLEKAKEIFGHDKSLFLHFLNAETANGEREEMRYSTPLILASYNDDVVIAMMLLQAGLDVLGKDSPEFDEFVNAQDSDGSTAAFYAGHDLIQAAKKQGFSLRES